MTDAERLRNAIESVEPGWSAVSPFTFSSKEVCRAIAKEFGLWDIASQSMDHAVALLIAQAIIDVWRGEQWVPPWDEESK